MKYLTETYTPLINNLLELNQEIRQKLSSMPSFTGREMQNLDQWLGEVERLVKDLDNASLIICHHLKILRTEYKEKLEAGSLRH